MNVNSFLSCKTPGAWLAAAVSNVPLLLVDHANCEKKAAATALNLMYRYIRYPDLLSRLSKLAREELRHFEQVLAILQARQLPYPPVSSSRYAGGLRALVRTHDPARLIDLLIASAVVEARSCERFGALAEAIDDAELATFYSSLLASERRHFEVYLGMAERYAPGGIDDRVDAFLARDAELIATPDSHFRFHSGIPAGIA